jgi:hypothetical protein
MYVIAGDILIGATSSGISYHLRDIYSICICCWNVATYKWKIYNWKIEITLVVGIFKLCRITWPFLWKKLEYKIIMCYLHMNIYVTNDYGNDILWHGFIPKRVMARQYLFDISHLLRRQTDNICARWIHGNTS